MIFYYFLTYSPPSSALLASRPSIPYRRDGGAGPGVAWPERRVLLRPRSELVVARRERRPDVVEQAEVEEVLHSPAVIAVRVHEVVRSVDRRRPAAQHRVGRVPAKFVPEERAVRVAPQAVVAVVEQSAVEVLQPHRAVEPLPDCVLRRRREPVAPVALPPPVRRVAIRQPPRVRRELFRVRPERVRAVRVGEAVAVVPAAEQEARVGVRARHVHQLVVPVAAAAGPARARTAEPSMTVVTVVPARREPGGPALVRRLHPRRARLAARHRAFQRGRPRVVVQPLPRRGGHPQVPDVVRDAHRAWARAAKRRAEAEEAAYRNGVGRPLSCVCRSPFGGPTRALSAVGSRQIKERTGKQVAERGGKS